MRITGKGQVTIPACIREQAGFLSGTEVDFVLDGGTVRVVKAASGKGGSRGDCAVRLLRGSATVKPRLTTDEIMKLSRGE